MGQPYINNPAVRSSFMNNSQAPKVNQETVSFKGNQATGGDGASIAASPNVPDFQKVAYNFLTDSQSGLTYDVTYTTEVAMTNSIPGSTFRSTVPVESKISLKGINDIGIPEEVQIILKADGSAVLLRRNPPATEFQSSLIQPGEEIRLPDRGSLTFSPDGKLILKTASGLTLEQSVKNGTIESQISASADRLGSFQGFLGQALDADKSASNDFKQGIEAFKLADSGPIKPVPQPTPRGEVAANETASLLKTGLGTYAATGGDGGQQDVPLKPGIYNLLSDQNLVLNARVAQENVPPESTRIKAADSGIQETALTLGLRTVRFNADGSAVIGNADPRLKIADIPITFSTTPTLIPGGNGATVMLGRENTLIINTGEYEIVQKAELNGFISVTVRTLEKGVLSDGIAPTGYLGQSFDADNNAKNDFNTPLEKFQQDSLVPIPGRPPVVTDDALVATEDALTVVRIADKDGDGGVTQKELQAFIEGPQLASLKYAQLSKAAGFLLSGFDTLKQADGNPASISAQDVKIAAARDGNDQTLTLGEINAVPPSPAPTPSKASFSSQELKDILKLADRSTFFQNVSPAQDFAGPGVFERLGIPQDGKITFSELDSFIQRSNTQIQQLQQQIRQLEQSLNGKQSPTLLQVSNIKIQILKAQLSKLQHQVESAQFLKDNFGLFSSNARFGNPPAGGLPTAVIISGDIDRVAANTAPSGVVTPEDLEAEQKKLINIL